MNETGLPSTKVTNIGSDTFYGKIALEIQEKEIEFWKYVEADKRPPLVLPNM